MRFPFFCSLILSLVACAPDSELHLETFYDLTLTLEEETCGGDVRDSVHEASGTLFVVHSDAADTVDLDFDIFFLPQVSIGVQLRNIAFKEDGYFEGWSSYAFDREGEIFVPFFHFMQGSATTAGFEARYTVYMSDEPEDRSVPTCRYIWQIHDR